MLKRSKTFTKIMDNFKSKPKMKRQLSFWRKPAPRAKHSHEIISEDNSFVLNNTPSSVLFSDGTNATEQTTIDQLTAVSSFSKESAFKDHSEKFYLVPGKERQLSSEAPTESSSVYSDHTDFDWVFDLLSLYMDQDTYGTSFMDPDYDYYSNFL
ncbi:hypothetical protein OGAPHI_006261 [Ogataea philodendri]|uniref:Uncharacterized protein n=1 Tax=Ogataea philodendri TaxID=1378263 RepID=A0A9P8NYY8_9ASCO|nr:uncharacterized protein OGAPHI_006261 [Ogataea philodendri]KAH3662080.1 hypothetical protein OGAPHI_006261 [Ogataea philodendri]